MDEKEQKLYYTKSMEEAGTQCDVFANGFAGFENSIGIVGSGFEILILPRDKTAGGTIVLTVPGTHRILKISLLYERILRVD
jgi:hypothetical protein